MSNGGLIQISKKRLHKPIRDYIAHLVKAVTKFFGTSYFDLALVSFSDSQKKGFPIAVTKYKRPKMKRDASFFIFGRLYFVWAFVCFLNLKRKKS